MWTIVRKTAPTQMPLNVDEVKRNIRLPIDDNSHDRLLSDSIASARDQVEHDTSTSLTTATYVQSLDAFPNSRASIPLYIKPVQSITEIRYTDTEGNSQTLDSAVYALDNGRQEVYLKNGQSWPRAIEQQNAVEIEFAAGFGDNGSDVPPILKQMLLLQVGKWFTDPGMEATANDDAYERLARRYQRSSYP